MEEYDICTSHASNKNIKSYYDLVFSFPFIHVAKSSLCRILYSIPISRGDGT